jgi:hypothetical protein
MVNLDYVNCRPHNGYAERQGVGDRLFGNQSQSTFQAGVRAMAKRVKTHGARKSNVFEAIEVHKNLPTSWARVAQESISFQ